MVKEIRHAGIVTNSIAESLKFYVDVLGFKKSQINLETGEALSKMLSIQDCRVKTCKIETESGGAKLELLEFLDSSHSTKELSSHSLNQLGLTHFAITIDSLSDLYNKLKELENINIISEPVKTDGGPSVMFFKDVNKVFIEAVEE